MNETQRMQDEADRKRRAERDAEMNAAESQGGLNGLLEFFKTLLGALFDFIFGEDPNAPHESPEDSQPVSMPDKIQTARTVISSGALEKWNAFKQEQGGKSVTHINPVSGDVRKTSDFGMRKHPVHGTHKMHSGIDMVGDSDIQASADGIVLFVGRKGGYGNTVMIGHADGTTTLYGHMTGDHAPKIGSFVAQGAVIGEMGKTGTATGVHLHYEQRMGIDGAVRPVLNGAAQAHVHAEDKQHPAPAAPANAIPANVRAMAQQAVKPLPVATSKPEEKSLLADGLQFSDVSEASSRALNSAKAVFSSSSAAIGGFLRF